MKWFKPLDTDLLLALYHETGSRLGVSFVVREELFQWILDGYSESHRRYHNLEHLGEMLSALQDFRVRFREWDAVVMAAFYHDIIYQPGSKKNEADSARFARAALVEMKCDAAFINRVEDLILATERHVYRPGDADAALFLDIDMAILAAPVARYDRYTDDLRYEFRGIPGLFFRRGRRKFLKQLLSQDRIFHSEPFETFEGLARTNIERELREKL